MTKEKKIRKQYKLLLHGPDKLIPSYIFWIIGIVSLLILVFTNTNKVDIPKAVIIEFLIMMYAFYIITGREKREEGYVEGYKHAEEEFSDAGQILQIGKQRDEIIEELERRKSKK